MEGRRKYIPVASLLLAVREQAKKDENKWRHGKNLKRFIISPLEEWKRSNCRILLKICSSLLKDSIDENVLHSGGKVIHGTTKKNEE